MQHISDRTGAAYEVAREGDVYHALRDGVPVARCAVDRSRGCVSSAVVFEPSMRGRGICSALYDAIERDLGTQLKPSRIRTAAGRMFWASRLGASNARRSTASPP